MRFDERAGTYDSHALVQEQVADWSAEWLESSTSGLRALELGAGTGLFTRHLCHRGFASLSATDLAPAMIERGRVRAPEAHWAVMNAWDPAHPAVDRLYSCSLLQWTPEPGQTLHRWWKLLQPGGRALVTLFVEGSLGEWEVTRPGFSALPWRKPDEWESWMTEAGFRLLRRATWEKTLRYESAIATLRSLHQLGAVEPLRCPPGELRGLLRKYDALFRRDGSVPVTWHALRVELTRD